MKIQTMLLSSMLFAATATANELIVYTYDSFNSEWGPGPGLEAAFEKQCACDLVFVAVEDGVSILNRLRVEGASSKADVLLGIDDALMEETRAENLVQPHSLALGEIDFAIDWQDTDFIPFDYGYFSFVYDSDKIAKPVGSLDELVRSSASVIYQDPRTSTPGQGLMLWMKSVYGDTSDAAWKQLAGHTVTVTKGWWEAYSLFLQGDADYVLSYNTSPAYHVIAEKKKQYKAAEFSEGHVAQIEVAAITANSKQVELGKKFLAFLLSVEAQTIIPVTNWMLPVIINVDLPETFSELIKPQRIGYSPAEVAANRQQWIREWRRAAVKD